MKIDFLKTCLLLSALSFLSSAHAFNVGFNQAWFHNNYASQYLDGYFDEKEVERLMRLTQEAGSKSMRLWLFESSDFPMLEWNGPKISGIKPEFVRNFIKTLRIAQNYDVQIYMTFFDAHSYRPDQLKGDALAKLRAVYQPQGGDEFLKKVIGPLLKAIESEKLSHVIGKIDLTNEMDAVINRFGFDQGWTGAGRMLCQWRSYIQAHDSFKSTPVTFSLRLHPVIIHPLNLLSDKGPMACADFLDFHSYGDSGEIYRCRRLRAYAKKNKKDLILGEFGQGFLNHRYDDQLQLKNTLSYIKNAKQCGFKEALSWRLSDIRPGENKEARYSFEAYGQMRPAYWAIQKNNLSQP